MLESRPKTPGDKWTLFRQLVDDIYRWRILVLHPLTILRGVMAPLIDPSTPWFLLLMAKLRAKIDPHGVQLPIVIDASRESPN